MTKNLQKIKELFNYNEEYIYKNQLDTEDIVADEIEVLRADEVFVKHPEWNDYYISQYGRAVSYKGDSYRLLSMNLGGGGYYYYKFSELPHNEPTTIGVHRAVADIFCPNFWQDKNRNQLQAHHLDHNIINNYFKNICLLPSNLHTVMNRTKKLVYFHDNTFEEMTPYEIMEETNLSLNEIILATKNNKPEKASGKYSVYQVKGHLIGFQFYPKKNNKKK